MASIGIRGGPRFTQFLGEVKLAVGGPRGVVVERTRAVVGVGVLLTEGGREAENLHINSWVWICLFKSFKWRSAERVTILPNAERRPKE